MTKLKLTYQGSLKVKSTHLSSKEVIFTDAPKDNNGEGKYFSPTDMIASSYASCMLTVIGIYCQNNNLKFENGEVFVEKKMASNPRRIGELILNFYLSNNGWDDLQKSKIEEIALNCPVAKSINEDINTKIEFSYE